MEIYKKEKRRSKIYLNWSKKWMKKQFSRVVDQDARGKEKGSGKKLVRRLVKSGKLQQNRK